MSRCPAWCVADHSSLAARDHHGVTHVVGVTLEGRGSGVQQQAELIVEMSRRHDEAGVWVYLGDGWTGFSLSLESATRLSAAVSSTLRTAGTIDPTGL